MEHSRSPEFLSSNEQQRDTERERFKERKFACNLLLPRDDKSFEMLLTDIAEYNDSEHSKDSARSSSWNRPDNYTEIMRILLPYATKNKHESFFVAARKYRESLEAGVSDKEALISLANAMRNDKVCEDISIAEIGGMFTKDFFEKLGAHVAIADAGLPKGYTDSPIAMAEQIVTPDNIRQFFPDEYDIVCTNNVLTGGGSGIDDAAKMGGIPVDDFPLYEYMLVKDGGAIINYTERIHRDEEIGFRYNHLRPMLVKLHEYAKQHPKSVEFYLFGGPFDPTKPPPRYEATIKIEKSEDF